MKKTNMEPVILLQKLIQIPSFSGNEEKLAEFIISYCKNNNIPSFCIDGNIIIRYPGIIHTKALIFNAHMDTVSAGNIRLWKHPPVGNHAGKIKGDKIYGLGASDDKASIASLLLLAKSIKNPACDIWITFVKNEETDGSGTAKFINWFAKSKYIQAYKNISVIICEPTNLKQIETGNRGNTFVKLETQGISGHGALSYKKSDLAIVKMVRYLDKLNNAFEIWGNIYNHKILGKPSMNITNIKASAGSYNKIPDKCSVILDIRTTPVFHIKLEMLLNKIIDKEGSVIKILGKSDPGSASSKSRIMKVIKKILPQIHTSVSLGSTDLSQFIHGGFDTVVFGPGNKNIIHKENECADISDLEKAVDIYSKLILTFANEWF